MAPMPKLIITGTNFVLTGRMWTDRKHIESLIRRKGGTVSSRIQVGTVLVMASGLLQREADGKWHTRGNATAKAQAAMNMKSPVYHEKMLRDALESSGGVATASRVSGLKIDERTIIPQTIHDDTPEWNDEMQAKLDSNMRKTSELLGSF